MPPLGLVGFAQYLDGAHRLMGLRDDDTRLLDLLLDEGELLLAAPNLLAE